MFVIIDKLAIIKHDKITDNALDQNVMYGATAATRLLTIILFACPTISVIVVLRTQVHI
jgi:hypothetical protein